MAAERDEVAPPGKIEGTVIISTVAYIGGGALIAVVLHGLLGMRCENAIHAIMGMYVAVLLLGVVERNWPWVLYYFSALLISVAVLWMGRRP